PIIATVVRLPNRRHSHPVEGMETSEPIPPASRIRPICAGLACTRSRMAGSRDTQVPSCAPLTAKTSAVPSAAFRSRVPDSAILSIRPVHSLRGAQTRRLPSSLRSSVQPTPRRSRSLPQPAPSTRFAALRRAVFPLAALVSPADAAPLPLAPSVRPVHSLRGAQTRRLPSSLRSSVQPTPRRSRSLPQPTNLPGSPGRKPALTVLDASRESVRYRPDDDEEPVRRYRLVAAVAVAAAAGIPGIAIAASSGAATTGALPTVTVQAVPSSCVELAPIRKAADHWISGHSAGSTDNTWFNA